MENASKMDNIKRVKLPFCAYDPDHAHPADSPCDNCGIWLCTGCGWKISDKKLCNDCYKKLNEYGARLKH